MNAKDIKRLNEIAGVLGNALKEVQGLIEKYNEPQKPRQRKSLKKERVQEYQYLLMSGKMTKKRAV